MRQLKLILLINLIFLSLSCDNNNNIDCSAVTCQAATPTILLNIIENNENVFDSNTYTLDDIAINDSNIEISLITGSNEANTTLLYIQDPDWTEGNFEYTFTFGSDTTFNSTVTFLTGSESECCGRVTSIENISVNTGTLQERTNSFYTLILN